MEEGWRSGGVGEKGSGGEGEKRSEGVVSVQCVVAYTLNTEYCLMFYKPASCATRPMSRR